MEANHELPDEDEEYYIKPPKERKSSKKIVIPVVEDDVDLDTVREYISQLREQHQVDKFSSNKATNGSKLADFDSEGIGERDVAEIVPVHLYEVKEKLLEEYKRRLDISESKYKQCEEALGGADPERALLFVTEASSILYEQFVIN